MAAEIHPEECEADNRELGVPVRPRDQLAEHSRGHGKLLQRQFEDVVGHALLEVEDPPAVDESLRGIAVGPAARDLVGEHETEPDQELAGEIGVAAWENAASCFKRPDPLGSSPDLTH